MSVIILLILVGVPTSPTSLTVNNLLLGKSAIVSSRGRRLGPPPGAVPPTRQTIMPQEKLSSHARARSNDTISWNEEKSRKSLSRRNSVKWKDIKKEKEKRRKTSIDLDETGDGVIVSEVEANKMIATLRSRSSSETSSYSSHSASSTDTSLCDDNERASDSEPDLPDDNEKNNSYSKSKKCIQSPVLKDTKNHSTKPEVLFPTETMNETRCLEKPIKSITDYLDSAAGEPLRTYIDGFETKLKHNSINDECETYKRSNMPINSSRITPEKDNVIQRLNRTKFDETHKDTELTRPTNFNRTPIKFMDLSPIDLSPCHCGDIGHTSIYEYDFESNFRRPVLENVCVNSRPADIIDSFTKYPNFVPDIDLSDKNTSDLDSPVKSPGTESIIVSEDERPIPLKIDKYFEHSPEFFGARMTDPNNADIPNRRPTKRLSRHPKKPDSLTLQSRNSDKLLREEAERASSVPQSHSFMKSENNKINDSPGILISSTTEVNDQNVCSPKEYLLRTGKKNSERALQIIQENSKILSRILTKQNIAKKTEQLVDLQKSSFCRSIPEKSIEHKLIDSPSLKESTSDSIIGYRKRNLANSCSKNIDTIRIRPISIDDPFSLESRGTNIRIEDFNVKYNKNPSTDDKGNKTDLYGWENKGFLVKCDTKNKLENSERSFDYELRPEPNLLNQTDYSDKELKPKTCSEWTRQSISGESKQSITLPSSEIKDISTYERRYTSDDYNYPFSSKYNDIVVSKASDIGHNRIDQELIACDNLSKTDISQVSEFAHIVTSSISFTYEPSVEDDSPMGAKSNSSDTLCQITSLDQVSTPISPKIFSKDTPTQPKDYIEKSDKNILDSDDTCSAITSLIDTDTLSSLSYPRSPSSGSYHPFPTRPVMRMPKELGVRLGMYPKDPINSPSK